MTKLIKKMKKPLLYLLVMLCCGVCKGEKIKIYKCLEDTRVAITALRPLWNFEPIIKDGQKLNSSVEWLGKDSYIILISTTVDLELWDKYLKQILLKDYKEAGGN